MVSSSAEPSVICHKPGMTSTANERSSSNSQRADEGGGDRAGAGEDGHEDEAAGRGPVRHVGIDMADGQRRERAAEAAEHAGDHQLDMDRCR